MKKYLFVCLLMISTSSLGYPSSGQINMKFKEIPVGTFVMGSPENEVPQEHKEHHFFDDFLDEQQHQVTLTRDFEMQTTEVTQKQWEGVMGRPTNIPDDLKEFEKYYERKYGPQKPIFFVTYWSAISFANKISELEDLPPCYKIDLKRCRGEAAKGDLKCHPGAVSYEAETIYQCKGYRLPTEAEWEYAARAMFPHEWERLLEKHKDTELGSIPTPPFSCNEKDIRWYADICGLDNNFVGDPANVATKFKNPFGLYDMYGNLWEWVEDWYGEYPTGPVTDPTGPIIGDSGVYRGGNSMVCTLMSRSANRMKLGKNGKGSRGSGIGFRLVRSLN